MSSNIASASWLAAAAKPFEAKNARCEYARNHRRPRKAKSLYKCITFPKEQKNALSCCGVPQRAACSLGRPCYRPDSAGRLDRDASGATEAPRNAKRKRHLDVHHHGRLGDALITEATETSLYYRLLYTWRGVQRFPGHSHPPRPASARAGASGRVGELEIRVQESSKLHPDLRGV